jgi:hypothetical protein
MKIKLKKQMTLGELVAAVFQVWGAAQAGKMLRLAIKTHMVVLREPARFLVSAANPK